MSQIVVERTQQRHVSPDLARQQIRYCRPYINGLQVRNYASHRITAVVYLRTGAPEVQNFTVSVVPSAANYRCTGSAELYCWCRAQCSKVQVHRKCRTLLLVLCPVQQSTGAPEVQNFTVSVVPSAAKYRCTGTAAVQQSTGAPEVQNFTVSVVPSAAKYRCTGSSELYC